MTLSFHTPMTDEPSFVSVHPADKSRHRTFWITDNAITDELWHDTDRLRAEYDEFYASAGARYLLVATDTAPLTGKKHLHVFLSFANAKTYRAVRARLPRGDHVATFSCQTEAHQQHCISYGRSKECFFEWGTAPVTAQAAGDAERERWENALSMARRGRLDGIPASMLVPHYRNFVSIRNDSLSARSFPDGTDIRRRFVWLVSHPGTGKSALAREIADGIVGTTDSCYNKISNTKWWDGYSGERFTLIDDFAPGFPTDVKQAMKIWCDRYAFRGEPKGGSMLIRPEYIFVTSNYSIQQCFGKVVDDLYEDTPDSLAMERRFTVIDMNYVEYKKPSYEAKKEQILSLLDLPEPQGEPEPAEPATLPLPIPVVPSSTIMVDDNPDLFTPDFFLF